MVLSVHSGDLNNRHKSGIQMVEIASKIRTKQYSGDLDNEHLKNELYLSGVQMSVIQMVVRYSNGGLNPRLNFVQYSNGI